MASSTTSSPFTSAVVSAIRKVYPEELADKSFDNTGLLLEAPFDRRRATQKNSVLLAIDLTSAVADEAIERKDSVIVAYHPIIFRGLKSLTLADTQQRSLLRLAAAGISVYCPHTAVDVAQGGNADWLADIVTAEMKKDVQALTTTSGNEIVKGYALQHFPSSHDTNHSAVSLASLPHDRTAIVPDTSKPHAGLGRHIRLHQPQPLSNILTTLTTYLSHPPSISVATPQGHSDPGSIQVSTIAICAGSGGSIFSKLKKPADLLLTGELVHHEALAAIENGTSVVCFNHSNSERAYLGAVMKGLLEKEIAEEWTKARQSKAAGEGEEGWEEEGVTVAISKADRDPFGYLVKS